MVGPTMPNPGPILLKVAATALQAEIKSGLSGAIQSSNRKNRERYKIK